MVNAIFGFFAGFVGWLASHLPNSPLREIAFDTADGVGHYTIAELLAWVNWLIPFNKLFLVMEAWLLAATTFIAIRIILKVLKLRGKVAL